MSSVVCRPLSVAPTSNIYANAATVPQRSAASQKSSNGSGERDRPHVLPAHRTLPACRRPVSHPAGDPDCVPTSIGTTSLPPTGRPCRRSAAQLGRYPSPAVRAGLAGGESDDPCRRLSGCWRQRDSGVEAHPVDQRPPAASQTTPPSFKARCCSWSLPRNSSRPANSGWILRSLGERGILGAVAAVIVARPPRPTSRSDHQPLNVGPGAMSSATRRWTSFTDITLTRLLWSAPRSGIPDRNGSSRTAVT